MPDEAVFELEEQPLYACPQALVDSEALDALEMWAWTERGFLPRAGGIDDQFNRDLALIIAVEAVRQKTRET